MSETTDQAKELLKMAAEADAEEVSIPITMLQVLVDQAELRAAATPQGAVEAMDQALESWADAANRQRGAINRLIEQNRVFQRRVAELQVGRPLEISAPE